VFEEFRSFSEEELKTAFAFFKTNNVKDLILDMRYNLGGVVSVAQSLASYIGGSGLTGKTFTKLLYNDKNQASNSIYPFKTLQHQLSLPRIAIITSRYTASASELIINGLNPFMDVVTIGQTTRGKPTGMNIWYCGKKYVFVPVTFKTVNSLNEGEFYDGFEPSKPALDDIAFDFDNRNEESLSEAIAWLQTGSFSGKRTKGFSSTVHFDEKKSFPGSIVLEKR
jgi:hypothetical protein